MRRKGSILIVEDDTDTAGFMEKFLKGEGYDVHVVHSRDRAALLLEQIKVDVIFLDYWMKGMTASLFTSSLKKNHPEIRIVLMTAAHGSQAIARVLDIDHILNKPFTEIDLLACMKAVVMKQLMFIHDASDPKYAFVDGIVRSGYHIWSVSNEEEAANGLLALKPHIIVASWGIYGLDGHSVISNLRQRFEFLGAIPTVLLTNRSLHDDTIRRLWLDGFRHIVSSNPDADTLLRTIRRAQGTTAILRIQRHTDSSVVA